MKKIALTGGIGSGKSTVARLMQQQGLTVIDADKVVHELYEDKKIIGMLLALFGRDLNENGKINRKKLGSIIFQDAKKKAILDQFFRSRINERVKARFDDYEKIGRDIVIYDATLIYEWGIENDFDVVIVVDAPLEERIERICMRDHLMRSEAIVRIQSQIPLEKKVQRADIVITNDVDFATLSQKVTDVVRLLRE